MINYCIDYIYQDGDYVDYGTIVESSEQERADIIETWNSDKGYTIIDVYENEDCYCHAYYSGECACGNFK